MNEPKDAIEIERKFLLKRMPSLQPDSSIVIKQYYYEMANGERGRIRESFSDVDGTYFTHTVKQFISKGQSREIEYPLTLEEFEQIITQNKGNSTFKFIHKVRYIYKAGNLKWEVDNFSVMGWQLIIAEIELPILEHKLFIPDYIKENMLLEVTDLQQFSNKNMAESLPK